MIWYDINNKMKQPWPASRPFLVAVEMDGHCIVAEGRRFKKGLRAPGINAVPYAWAYMPKPPTARQVRSILTGFFQP